MASNQETHWFVARTRARQEKKIRRTVEELGIEVYLPIREEIRQWHDRRKKVEVVLIPGILFIHTDKETALSIPNEKCIPIRYAINTTHVRHEIMTVPDHEMEKRFGSKTSSSMRQEQKFESRKDRWQVLRGNSSGWTT